MIDWELRSIFLTDQHKAFDFRSNNHVQQQGPSWIWSRHQGVGFKIFFELLDNMLAILIPCYFLLMAAFFVEDIPRSSLRKGRDVSTLLDWNLLRVARLPLSFWKSCSTSGSFMSQVVWIFSKLASIPLWVTTNLRKFLNSTPKMNFCIFSFICYHRRTLNVSWRSCMWSLTLVDFTSISSAYTPMFYISCWQVLGRWTPQYNDMCLIQLWKHYFFWPHLPLWYDCIPKMHPWSWEFDVRMRCRPVDRYGGEEGGILSMPYSNPCSLQASSIFQYCSWSSPRWPTIVGKLFLE